MGTSQQSLTLTVALLIGTACGEDAARGDSGFTRGGPAAVDSLALHGSLADLPALRVTDTITLTGAAEDLFARNPSATIALRDGRTILSDGRTYAVFARDGRYQGPFSRQGAGPGEIRFLQGIWQWPGDSLWTVDAGTRRISVFDSALQFVRSFQYPHWGDESGIVLRAPLARDTVAAVRYRYLPLSAPPGPMTVTVDLGLWDVEADSAALSITRPYSTAFVLQPGILPEPIVTTPFGGEMQWSTLGRCHLYGFSAEWRLQLDAPGADGQLVVVADIRAPDVARVPVDDTRKEEYIRSVTARIPSDGFRASYGRALREQVPFAPHLPAFGRVLTARDGSIWVQDYRGPTTDRPDQWTILDAANLRAWRLTVPARSRLLAADSARALIATADADDVETQHWWLLPELAGIQPPQPCRIAN